MGDVRISAKSTLLTLNRSIEVISGNLTGASIFGYKGVRLSFADTLVNLVRSGTGSTGGSGGLNPIQVGTGGIGISATTTDFSQGSIIQTKSQSDLAIQGNAFFATVDAAGKITYTRNGEFHFDDAGNLVTNDGNFVLGVFDDSRNVIHDDRLVDFDTTLDLNNITNILAATTNRKGISMNFAGMNDIPIIDINGATVLAQAGGNNNFGNLSFTVGNVFQGGTSNQVTLFSFLDLTSVDGLQDRVLPQTFVAAGSIGTLNATGVYTGNILLGTIMGTNGTEVAVNLTLTDTNNRLTNTSLDNAKLIAQAINDAADETGIGATVIVNSNKLDQAAITLTHINRSLSSEIIRTEVTNQDITAGGVIINTTLRQALSTTEAGVLKNATDARGNLFHRINIKSLIGSSPRFVPESGDTFHFDGTGVLINDSRGLDENSAPPFNTGIHAAINKFSNNDGLQKIRGSSQFQYSEAAGNILVGYAGEDTGKKIISRTGVEDIGSSIIGAENTIIPQALEGANTSITEALPELTIAQKSFTSNTKVVNVGNSIVDDLNGLIR